MLSGRPKQILDFIQGFMEQYGYPPSVRQIQQGVTISSTSVVKYNLEKLKKLGYIEHDKRVSRGIRLVEQEDQDQLARVPVLRRPEAGKFVSDATRSVHLVGGNEDLLRVAVLGRIVASEPVPIPDSNFNPLGEEAVLLTRDIVKEQEGLYALQVSGNSMIDALVNDGDIVVMKHVQEAHNGEMVAVWLDDRKETTLKRFYREKTGIRLQPANPLMDPIYVQDPSSVRIQGKVVAVIRKLD